MYPPCAQRVLWLANCTFCGYRPLSCIVCEVEMEVGGGGCVNVTESTRPAAVCTPGAQAYTCRTCLVCANHHQLACSGEEGLRKKIRRAPTKPKLRTTSKWLGPLLITTDTTKMIPPYSESNGRFTRNSIELSLGQLFERLLRTEARTKPFVGDTGSQTQRNMTGERL
jgi:hypothetical protein